MRYTVVWKPEAEDELAAVWVAARDQDAVTRAAHRIDRALASDPVAAGEERPPAYRILFDPPLGVVFEVDERNRGVRVLSAGWSGRPA